MSRRLDVIERLDHALSRGAAGLDHLNEHGIDELTKALATRTRRWCRSRAHPLGSGGRICQHLLC